MTTPKSLRSKDALSTAKRPPVEDRDTDLADDLEGIVIAEIGGLEELSFDDDSRSDRHSATGSEQSAQSDNAPDENVDELDDGNDIGEQNER